MKQKIEKVIKREDGSRVKIIVELINSSYSAVEYRCSIMLCKKGKRTWEAHVNTDNYTYRSMSMYEREKFRNDELLKYASAEELIGAKLELWQSIRPTV